jgi:hypothetical protein
MRKPQPQPSLASLSPDDKTLLADWLRKDHYPEVLQRANKPRSDGGLGLSISKKPLQTFYAKVALLDLVNSRLPNNLKLTITEFESIAANNVLLTQSHTRTLPPPPESAPPSLSSLPSVQKLLNETHLAILETTRDLAKSGDNTPSQLLALQKLADFPARSELRVRKEERELETRDHKIQMDLHRKEMAEHRKHIADERLTIAQRLATIREEELALKRSKPAGSSPTDGFKPWSPEELPARQAESEARIQADPFLSQIGLPPQDFPDPTLSETETLTPTDPEKSAFSLRPDFHSGEVTTLHELTASAVSPTNTPREAPDQKCQMKNDQCSMLNERSAPNNTRTSTKTPHLPETQTLEHRVNQYTLARYHEALHGKDSSKVGRSAAWNFRSAMQHCPCGQHLPCPEHGDFPPYFFELIPDDADYFQLLQKKKLPFTPIHELLLHQERYLCPEPRVLPMS